MSTTTAALTREYLLHQRYSSHFFPFRGLVIGANHSIRKLTSTLDCTQGYGRFDSQLYIC